MVTQSGEQAQLPIHEISEAEFVADLPHWRTNIWPKHWPENVRMISQNGLSLIGLDDEGQIYLNGKRLHIEKRFAAQERVIAWIATLATAVAAIAAVASAYADWQPKPADKTISTTVPLPDKPLALRPSPPDRKPLLAPPSRQSGQSNDLCSVSGSLPDQCRK